MNAPSMGLRILFSTREDTETDTDSDTYTDTNNLALEVFRPEKVISLNEE
jgi:hypothetical protein